MKKEKKPLFKSELARKQFLGWADNHAQMLIAAAGLSMFKLHKISWISLPSKSAMEIEVDHKYLYFNLDINEAWAAERWRKKEYEELLLVLTHEIAHVATTEPQDNLIYKSCSKDKSFYFERLTEITSRWLYQYYRKHYMDYFNITLETGETK